MAELLFVTGYLRTGTTLLARLLDNHREVCIGIQPFPLLFQKAKEAFCKEKGIELKRYHLDHLFLEQDYSREEFTAFLKRKTFNKEEVEAAFKAMESYSGQMMPQLQAYLDNVRPGTFLTIYRQLVGIATGTLGRGGRRYIGSKEVYCEEFIPLFVEGGVKVALIIRDPRDVLTSINFAKGHGFAGQPVPTLYVLRKWRKSVAFAMAYSRHPSFISLRYEDLVRDAGNSLERMTAFLGLEPFAPGQFAEGISDWRGGRWEGNSSYGSYKGISEGSIGKFKEKLPVETVRYVESICFPEMLAMGYDMHSGTQGFCEETVREFREPVPITRTNFPADYSTDKARIDLEVRRYRLLSENVSQEDKAVWFIFPGVYDQLKKTLDMRLSLGERRA